MIPSGSGHNVYTKLVSRSGIPATRRKTLIHGCIMFARFWFILAQVSESFEGQPSPVTTSRRLNFSDLQHGLRQAGNGNGNDHTFLYGIGLIIGMILLIVLLARVWTRWSLDELVSQFADALFGPFSELFGREGSGTTKASEGRSDAAFGSFFSISGPRSDLHASPPKNIAVLCPNLMCHSILIVPPSSRGRNVRCSHCKQLVRIPPCPHPSSRSSPWRHLRA
jgi:hypothetical protein